MKTSLINFLMDLAHFIVFEAWKNTETIIIMVLIALLFLTNC
jgi:hypothetical protein